MKTSPRIHRNGATKSVSAQAKTARRAPAEHPSDPMPTLAVCARFKRRGEFKHTCLIDDIGITQKEWVDACVASKKMGTLGRGDFFADAIREKLSGKLAQASAALTELEIAKSQSNALLQLLEDAETNHMLEGDLEHSLRREMNGGVAQLVRLTKERLNNAFDGVFAAIHPKPAEVAS